MDAFKGELEEKMERFEVNLRTLSEAKRKYSVEGLFRWVSSPRSTAEEDFGPFSSQAIEEYLLQGDQEHDNQMQESQSQEEHEESICAEDYVDIEDDEDHAEEPEEADDGEAETDLFAVSETSMSAMQQVEEVTLPTPTTKTEVAIRDILDGMMDTCKNIAESNKKILSGQHENEAPRRIERTVRRRLSNVLTRTSTPAMDADVETAVEERILSLPKTSTQNPSPLFSTEFPRVQADSSLTRKPARTYYTVHEPVDGLSRVKRKRTLGPFTQVKVSASDSEDAAFPELSAGTTPTICYKEYRPSQLRPLPQLKSIGRRASDEVVGRHRRLNRRRQPVALAEATPSPDASPRPVVELFLNKWATSGGGSGGGGAQSSASDDHVTPSPEPRQRLSWRSEQTPRGVGKKAEEQPSPREVSPRVPNARRPKRQPKSTPAAETTPVRQRISWRSEAPPEPKSLPAEAPESKPVDKDAGVVSKPRHQRRRAAKPAPVAAVEEKVEETVELVTEPDPEPPTASEQRGRGNRTHERQQRRQSDLAVRTLADEVAAHIRAQRQWLHAKEEMGGDEAALMRCYELPTVSSVMKRNVKSYMPAVGLTGIPFVVGTSTSPTHHCGLKMQAEMRKFKLRLASKLGQYSSAVTTCPEMECAEEGCPAAAQAQSTSHAAVQVSQRPEDRWADNCTEPNCTCSVRKSQPANKVLKDYVPSHNRLAGSRLNVTGAATIASATVLPSTPLAGTSMSALSKTDLHGESLQKLKEKIGGLKECLVGLQERFMQLHQTRDDPTLDLTEKQIADLDTDIANQEQQINVVLSLMREIFRLSRSQKTSVASVAMSSRSRRSHAVVAGGGGGGGGLGLRRK